MKKTKVKPKVKTKPTPKVNGTTYTIKFDEQALLSAKDALRREVTQEVRAEITERDSARFKALNAEIAKLREQKAEIVRRNAELVTKAVELKSALKSFME